MRRNPVLSLSRPLLLAACAAAAMPAGLAAQSAGSAVVGAGAGGTFYSISTRSNTGTIVSGVAGYELLDGLSLEAAARRHFCFDCERFTIGDISVQLRRPARALSPFLSAGFGVSSDPDAGFMDTHFGMHAGIGAWAESRGGWIARLEGRVRRVGGPGDAMGEVGVVVARRIRRR
jgi:hypothetical protein